MSIMLLKAFGKGFFVETEGYAPEIREDLREIICDEAFKRHIRDILEYRMIEYYRRRYVGEE